VKLKPPVSEADAFEWLTAQVVAAWGVEITPELEKNLRTTAEAMARISAIDVPEDIEPLLV
jgi:hypothetical protein